VGLNVIPLYRERYGCPVGLSDHSGSTIPALAAVAQGAELLEIHVTFSREMFGPDVAASITTAELAELVRGIRQIEVLRVSPVDKDRMAKELEPLRRTFTKSVVARRDLPAGTRLAEEDLTLKKPGTGIPAERLPELLGRRLRRAVAADALLAEEDLA
jgi:N-acetylneuraminate synthase